MSSHRRQYDQFKLATEFHGHYCTHTFSCPGWQGVRTEKWYKGKELGQGGFGTVWLEKEEKGSLRAVKMVAKSNILFNERELETLSTLRAYPELFVQFLGWFENSGYIFLAMEYVPHGDLSRFLRQKKGNMDILNSKIIARQLLQGLKVMHENNFCHRDLKPMNILIASVSPLVVKISDFGITKKTNENTACRTVAGTFAYAAPEAQDYLLSETSEYTNAVDIWSLGCVLYVFITKHPPFPFVRKLMEYIDGYVSFPQLKLMESGAGPGAIEFITGLMMVQPLERLSVGQALEHPWLSNDVEEETIWEGIVNQIITRPDPVDDTLWTTDGNLDDSAIGLSRMILRPDEGTVLETVLDVKGVEYFRRLSERLMDSVTEWCQKFSNEFGKKRCRSVHEISDELSRDRCEEVMLDDSGILRMLDDPQIRHLVFTAIAMRVIWYQVFTKHLFGLGKNDRTALLRLQHSLQESERASQKSLHLWRAITLNLFASRPGLSEQRATDTKKVVEAILLPLHALLPPNSNNEKTYQRSLYEVAEQSAQLAIEMRTQQAEYTMAPPPAPEYDEHGFLGNPLYFDAARMHNNGGEAASDKELQQEGAIVKLILFPQVRRRGDDNGNNYETEITVMPMQVLVNRPQH